MMKLYPYINNVFLFLVAALFGGLLTSCMKWDYGMEEEFHVTDTGLFITNEGNFQYGNATLSFYNPATKEIENEIFYRANAMKLGDVAQSMIIRDGIGWVVVNNSHVVFAIDRAGIVGSDGETHQGVFDLSFLSHIPNMTVLSPKNDWELGEMLDFAVNEWNGPIAVRYPRGTAETGFAEYKMPIEYGKAELVQDGEKIAILAEGHMLKAAADAAEMLKADGYQPMLVNMRFIKPLDEEMLLLAAEKCELVVTVEDNVKMGGFGSSVLEFYGEKGIKTDVLNLGFPDKYIEQGTQSQLFERYGLDAAGIYESVKKRLGD